MGDSHLAIEFDNVSLAFGDRVVLDRVSFGVRYGEAKVVMGGSGTGKSTLLRLVLGLLKPDEGRIFIDGEDITDYSEESMMKVRSKIGMVFQEGALFDSLPVYDNVAYRLREQKVPESEIEEATRLTEKDVVKIGPYALTWDGVGLTSKRPEQGTRIEVRGIGKVVTHRETGKPLWLLKEINLTILTKEIVVLLGSTV